MNLRNWYKYWLYLLTVVSRMNCSDSCFGKHYLQVLGFGFLSAVLTAVPVFGAEQVSFFYGPLEFSIPVTSLKSYAEEGKINNKLAVYAKSVTPQELAQLRQILLQRVKLNSVSISQFLYSSFGETSLRYLGEVIQTDSGLNGFYALRAALVLAATDPEGLTLLNVVEKFPSRTIRIRSILALQTFEAFTQLFDRTRSATAMLRQESVAEALAEPSVNPARNLDLQQPGPWVWQKATLSLEDRSRNRRLVTDLYLPNLRSSAPVIVISHGLGADRTDFAALAQHLASHGFAVAALDHPGSNSQQLSSLLRGAAREAVEPNEFVNRPLDVSYLLDELQRLNQSSPSLQGRFNLRQVGVLGHSFGGYTALALAGARLNFAQLQQECNSDTINPSSANFSLLLQCQALDLPSQTKYRLQDRRIRAVFALNPISSSIFGQKGLRQIQVPVMLVAGSDDTVTPALLEQICPFTWLNSPNKYLVLVQGGTHFYTNKSSAGIDLPLPAQLASPNPALTMRYLKAIGLAFAKTHVAAQPAYFAYLKASYAQAISQSPLPLWLVQSLPVAQLSQKSNFSGCVDVSLDIKIID